MNEADKGEVLVKVEGVSKKFCRSLKKSLWYGVCDIAGELNPLSRNVEGGKGQVEGIRKAEREQNSAAEEGKGAGLRPGEFWAVQDVSFELRRGECLGLIGHNGAGKTTLLKMLNGLIKPDSGRITMRGRVGALIALGAGFNPILTGRENIYINGSVLGLSKEEINEKMEGIIDFAEIREFIDMPVQNYSSGMQVRLGFSVATAMKPDVLLLDEVLAVGDATFRSKCFQRIGAIMEKCAVVFVSHDASSIQRICEQVLFLERGKNVFFGQTELGMELYVKNQKDKKAGEPVEILANYISDLRVHDAISEKKGLGPGTAVDVEIVISFQSKRKMELGLCMANIVTPDEVVAGQCLLDEVISPIRKGKNEWRFAINELHLAKGKYSVIFGIFEQGNKKLAIGLRHKVQFEVKGNRRYGPLYAPNATRILKHKK